MLPRLLTILLLVTLCLATSLHGQLPLYAGTADAFNLTVLKPGEDPAAKLKGNVFVQVLANKKTCYPGEPVQLTYRFCTRFVNMFTLLKTPSFNGFAVVDMQTPDLQDYTIENINGKAYRVFTLRKVQLYPMQPGNLLTDSVAIDNTLYFIKHDYLMRQPDFHQNTVAYMNELINRVQQGNAPAEALTTHKTIVHGSPVPILVKDYPAAGKPDSFAGATGQFNITASLAQQQLGTDEVGKLTVAISGSGNMMQVTAPEIRWPAGLEALEPTAVDRISHATMPVSGTQFFEYGFTAARPGQYTLPPLHFQWFNPQSGRYQSASTPPLTITVTQGSGQPSQLNKPPEAAKEQFFNKLFANRWWVAGPVIGLILLGLGLWMRNEHKKDKRAAAQAAQAKAAEAAKPQPVIEPANPLEKAAALLQGGPQSFFAQLKADLQQYLCFKLQMEPATFSKKTLTEALDRKGHDNALALELLQLWEAIEWQLYTPAADDAAKETLYHRALAAVETVKYRTQG
jgi:hypothetical protein